jgi:hypothetical protein
MIRPTNFKAEEMATETQRKREKEIVETASFPFTLCACGVSVT